MQLRSADEGATVFYKVSSGLSLSLSKQDLKLISFHPGFPLTVYELWRSDSTEQLENRSGDYSPCIISCCTE